MDNVSEGEDDADVEKQVSKAGNKYALFKEKSPFFLSLHTPLVKSWISMFLKCLCCSLEETKKKVPRRVTRVVFNKRTRQKAVLKKLTKEKYKEKISNEIDRYVCDFQCILMIYTLKS